MMRLCTMFLGLLLIASQPLLTALAQTPTPLPESYPAPIFQQNIELVIGTLVLLAILIFGVIRFRGRK